MNTFFRFTLIFVLCINAMGSYASQDSIIFKNNNFIVGEIKNLEKGVLTVETEYSDIDFSIDWTGVKEIYSNSLFLISLTSGERYNGTIKTIEGDELVIIVDDQDDVRVNIIDVVFLESVNEDFESRIYASIDLGFELTKAQNLQSFSARSNFGYLSEMWSSNGNINILNSEQDNTDPVRRKDGGIDFKYYLRKDWFAIVSVTFLSNTEQQIDLRTTSNIGLGRYLVQNNKLLWALSTGVSFNIEQFYESENNKESMEGFLGTELNLYDFDNISLLTKTTVIPSFTEANRWRLDFNFDLKYDLPYDFYIKTGITFNYDNKPVADASETDYIIRTGFGWEW